MIAITVQSSVTTDNTLQPANVKSKKPRLTAQWLMVDGKLFCQWIVT
ncbi:hypothetical protein QUB63_24030 [Microcoleus sp. ARI1-B5]